jgi:hypothetical protein
MVSATAILATVSAVWLIIILLKAWAARRITAWPIESVKTRRMMVCEILTDLLMVGLLLVSILCLKK